jgi:hypothetical protein
MRYPFIGNILSDLDDRPRLHDLCVKHCEDDYRCDCCGRDPGYCGFGIFIEGTHRAVCDSCADLHDPAVVRMYLALVLLTIDEGDDAVEMLLEGGA